MINKNGKYRIKGDSKYFKDKYGTSNPVITIEDDHEKVFGKWWGFMNGNPACLLYAVRSPVDNLPMDNAGTGKVFYGHVGKLELGELVHISELEEIKE